MVLAERLVLKCLWNEIFAYLFNSKILRSMILWFVIISSLGFGQARTNFSSSFKVGQFKSKCATFHTWSKYANKYSWRHKVCKTFKPSKHLREISKGVGSFSLSEGLFKRGAKHHLHWRHCLTYVFERQSQRNTLLAICSDTPAQLHSVECIRVVPSISNKVSIDGF